MLALRVREHTAVSDKLDHMSLYADFHLAGIMRPVYLFTTPNVHLADLKIVTTFDKDYRDATMTVRGRVLNESPQAFRGNVVRLELSRRLPRERGGCQGQDGGAGSRSLAERRGGNRSAGQGRAEKWNAEQPNLYTLTAKIRQPRQRRRSRNSG